MNREKIEYALADTAVKATVSACRGIGKVAQNKVLRNAGDFLLGATIAACVLGSTVYADGEDAEAVFSEIESQIGKWVTRIGGIVVIFGGINAGIGIANQDDAGRNRGFMTMAGGALLMAIVGALNLATS